MPPYRDDLYLSRDGVVAGVGVRAARACARGDFLGFYSGRVVSERTYARLLAADARVARVAFGVPRTARVIVRRGRADLVGYVNEPPAGERANVVAIPLHLDAGNAIAYYAAAPIAAHAELWVHYGRAAARDYDVGAPARAPRTLQRADAVLGALRRGAATRAFCAPRE